MRLDSMAADYLFVETCQEGSMASGSSSPPGGLNCTRHFTPADLSITLKWGMRTTLPVQSTMTGSPPRKCSWGSGKLRIVLTPFLAILQSRFCKCLTKNCPTSAVGCPTIGEGYFTSSSDLTCPSLSICLLWSQVPFVSFLSLGPAGSSGWREITNRPSQQMVSPIRMGVRRCLSYFDPVLAMAKTCFPSNGKMMQLPTVVAFSWEGCLQKVMSLTSCL